MKVFDVVELKNENRATIISIENNDIKAEIVDKKGKTIGVQKINVNDIARIIYQHK